MIEVKNLTKRYGDHLAISDISFKLSNGKVYGILGSYHSGKTTLLNIMTGCSSSTEGSVNINGFDIAKDPIRTKKVIGYLPDAVSLYSEMTTFEFLSFVARAKSVSVDQVYRQVSEVIELVQLDAVRNKLIKNLPAQTNRRIGVAQALLGNPEIVFMDEPTAGLAQEDAEEIRDLIRKIGQFKTVILTSPDPFEISDLCEQVLILSDGRLIANETLEELKSKTGPKKVVRLSVKGDKDTAINKLEQVEDIISFSDDTSTSVESGVSNFRIEVSDGTDPRDEIVTNLVTAGCSVVSISIVNNSLEAFFEELTQETARQTLQDEPEETGETEE